LQHYHFPTNTLSVPPIFQFSNPAKNQNLTEKLSKSQFFGQSEYPVFYILQRWKTSSFRQENTDRQISKV
jgi:hypothetical protein